MPEQHSAPSSSAPQAGGVRTRALALVMPVISLLLGVVVAELLLRVLVPSPSMYYVLQPGLRRVFRPDPTLVHGITGESVYEVNRDGMRGPLLTDTTGAQYHILAVGGSTTENLFLADDETWPGLLLRQLPPTTDGRKVWVADVGKSGMNARDHVVQVHQLLAQGPRMDLLIVLAGVNDLTVAAASSGGSRPLPLTDTTAWLAQERRAFSVVPGPFYAPRTDDLLVADAPWYKRTAIYQLGKRAKFLWQNRGHTKQLAQDASGSILTHWRSNRQAATALLDTMPATLESAVADFEQNLSDIAAEARRHRVRVLFLTQPSAWRASMSAEEQRFLWLGGTGDFQASPGHAYYTTRALRDGMDRFNRAILATCDSTGSECLDLASLIPSDTLDFYDDVHFTELGSRRVADAITAYLLERSPFARDVPRQETAQH